MRRVRIHHRVRWLVVAGALGACASCSGSGVPTPSPSLDLTLHAIPACGPSVDVPPDVSTVTPSATSPPTSVLRTGDAMAFSAPAGSRIGSVGTPDKPSGDVVCQTARGTGAARRAVIVGVNPGFVQVAIKTPGRATTPRTLVTVRY